MDTVVDILVILVFFIGFPILAIFILKEILWLVSPLFFLINRIQFALYNPLKLFMQYDPRVVSQIGYVLYLISVFTLISPVYWLVVHIFTIPIRLVNSFYFNFLFCIFSICDSILELIHPQVKGFRFLIGSSYFWRWIWTFPFRFVIFLLRSLGALFISMYLYALEVVFPTVSMYHGTQFNEHATKIVQEGKWLVGSGDFAGSGIYFGLQRRIAEHYASTSGEEPAVIVARVTLTFGRNALTMRKNLRRLFCQGGTGQDISRGLIFPWKSVEHWRYDCQWFEYCIVQPGKSGRYIQTWRIRPIVVLKDGKPTRIWGGITLWSGGFKGFIYSFFSWIVSFFIYIGFMS